MRLRVALVVGLFVAAACTRSVEPEPEPEVREPPPARPLVSRWDPPADLPHLESTPPELRERIDALVAVLMDTDAGREALDAQQELAVIGKPAFPRVVGAMAALRDQLTDEDTFDQRLLESSLMLGDRTLRLMDGYLDSHGKAVIQPGADRKYVRYILRLHYKRWVQHLSQMDELPGPYDPDES